MPKSKLHIVTVCLANRARSPTAEWLLHRNYKVKSCGTAELDATKPCDKYDMKWADKVLVMEPYQKRNLEMRFPKQTAGGKVTVLDVPEVGKYSCQPSLLFEIATRLEENRFKVRDIKDLERASDECSNWTWRMAERKMRSRRTKSYALTDFWSPTTEEEEKYGIPTSGTATVDVEVPEWKLEEERAFQRAAMAGPRGQGGITIPEEMTDEEVTEAFDQIIARDKARIQRAKKKFDEDLFDEYEQAQRRGKGTKIVDELKKYTDSVKRFFQS